MSDTATELRLMTAIFQMDPRNKAALENAAAEITRLRAEVGRLREALEPFRHVEMFAEHCDNKDVCLISAGTVRRARKALEAK